MRTELRDPATQAWVLELARTKPFQRGGARNWSSAPGVQHEVAIFEEFQFQELTGLPFRPGADPGYDHLALLLTGPRTIDIKGSRLKPERLLVPARDVRRRGWLANAYVLAWVRIRDDSGEPMPVWTCEFMGWATAHRMSQQHEAWPGEIDNYYVKTGELRPMSAMVDSVRGRGVGKLVRPDHMEQIDAKEWMDRHDRAIQAGSSAHR